MFAFTRALPVLVAATATFSTPAAASDDASRALVLTSHVSSFCQVQQASTELQVSNGSATFGPITEVCNGGYRVLASFMNLDRGTISTGDTSAPIADDGTVAFVRPEARKITHSWTLSDAVKHDSGAPVFVQVNVSPL